MQYCVDHPEEINKIAKVQSQVSEVKGVMMENIEKVKEAFFRIFLLYYHVYDQTWNMNIIFVMLHLHTSVELTRMTALHLVKEIYLLCRFLIVGRKLSCWWIKQRIFAHRLAA